jgi:hypothetical protein
MKIRNGYVSNSSSSSFVIRAEGNLSTVRDVAKYIMKTCSDLYGDLAEEDNDERFSDELLVLNKLNPDTPVFFNTGGDETYIRKMDDKIVLVTTQNIIFQEIRNASFSSGELDKEFFKQFDYFDEEEQEDVIHEETWDLDYYYHKFNDFAILHEEGLYGYNDYIYNCPLCKESFTSAYMLQNYGMTCECQLPKIRNILERKDKLKKINNENT